MSGSTVKKDDEVGVGPEKLPSKLGSKNKNGSCGRRVVEQSATS